MNANARNARRITKARRDAAKAHRAGLHTLKSHCLKAGLVDTVAGSVAGALRSKGKATGVTGAPAVMVRKTDSGVCFVRNARRYSKDEFRALAQAYSPRVKAYAMARESLLAYAGN